MGVDTSTDLRPRRLGAIALLLGAALAGAGCATPSPGGPGGAPGPGTGPDAGTGAATADELGVVGRARVGDTVTLAPGNPLGARRARIVDEYDAASGRTCRRVELGDAGRPRVVCLRADGRWSATRALEAATRDVAGPLAPVR